MNGTLVCRKRGIKLPGSHYETKINYKQGGIFNEKKVFKKLVSFVLAIALAVTCVGIQTNSTHAAKTKAIKIANMGEDVKTMFEGDVFTVKTNYAASKLAFRSSNDTIATIDKKGKIVTKNVGTAKITIVLKANKKIKKKLTVKVKRKTPQRVSYEDFDVSGLTVPMSYRTETFTNYVDLVKKYGDEIPSSPYYVEENSISYPNSNRNCSEENRSFKTARGIGLGSTKEDLFRVYKRNGGIAPEWVKKMYDTDEHTATELYECVYQFDNHCAAIKFVFDQKGKVMVILFD